MAVIAEYKLPLACCPTTNETIGAPWQRVQRLRRECHSRMLVQHLKQFGNVQQRHDKSRRVRVDCYRFSSHRPDAHANWSKVPVDILCRRTESKQRRLGLIWDDAPEYADVREHWQYAAPKQSGVQIVVSVLDASP